MNPVARAAAVMLLVSAVSAGQAQEATKPSTKPTVAATGDTAKVAPLRTKSPGLAAGLSALLPGAGQVYNESYWKVPIVAGLGGYFVYQILHNNRLYHDYQARYSESLQTIPGGDPESYTLREFYHDERDRFGWYFLILYALNILDAYVDASLYGFDVSGNLAVRVLPLGGQGFQPTLALQMRF